MKKDLPVMRVLLAAGLVTLMVSQASPAAPAPTPPPVRIEAVTHSARGPLRAGDRLTVTLRGSGGGSAAFHIFDLIAGVRMREIRTAAYATLPTVYTGTYVVRPGDAARNAVVFATLALRGTEAIESSPRPVTIDTRPPVITSRHPRPGTRLSNLRPNIALEMVDLETDVNPSSIRLLVNGQNVTAKTSISGSSIAYNPETPFRPGPVRVQVSVADRGRNTRRLEWVFHITPPGDAVKSVTINPANALTKDELLTVVMTGAPGGTATFTIEGIRGVVPMRESQTPGVYFGSLPVRPESGVVDALLRVTFERGGRRTTVPASALVTILPAPPPSPGITSRALSSETRPNGRFSVGGNTGPGFRILGRITYDMGPQFVAAERPVGEFMAVADPDGRWQVSVGPLTPLGRARLMLTVLAIDPAGQRSAPTTIELTL
jgi:hypothetical protein